MSPEKLAWGTNSGFAFRDDGFAKFSRKFFENVGAKIFSKNRSRRRDQFGPKIVEIRAILAIFEPFEVLGCQKSRIFERPFTPRGWLRSASNFGKTRFRRSPTFHLSTSKTNFRKFLEKNNNLDRGAGGPPGLMHGGPPGLMHRGPPGLMQGWGPEGYIRNSQPTVEGGL